MVLCDLPYGTTQSIKDTPIDLARLWSEYDRLTNLAVLFGHNQFTFELWLSNRDNYKYKWIWVKNKSTNHLNAKKMPMRQYEEILVFYRSSSTYNPQMTDGHKPMNYAMGGASRIYGEEIPTVNDAGTTKRYPKDVLYFDVVNNDDPDRIHEFQKPLDLCKYLIQTYTNSGDVVLDNACGSGTTCLAAKELGRNFIGIEIDKETAQLAADRIGCELVDLSANFT